MSLWWYSTHEGHAAPRRAAPSRGAPRTRVAIGTFDGVHIGHRAVIGGGHRPHLRPAPAGGDPPGGTAEAARLARTKRDLIGGLGVEELVVIPFDESFAAMEAEEFIDEILVKRLGAPTSRWGRTSASARRRAATPRCSWRTRVPDRSRAAGGAGWRDRLVDPHPRSRGGRRRGDAARCLGGPFLVEGEVVGGDERGRELGFPTANIVPDDRWPTRATASTRPGRTATRRR